VKRLILLAIAAALVVPATAAAKGPSAANINGPGTGGGLSIGGTEGSGPLGSLTSQGGFFQATFGQVPSSMLDRPPKGELGPKYTVVYTVPGPNGEVDEIRQDVYPYATPSPVTYTAPGQRFFGTERTVGGWYVADSTLKATLVAAGLPRTAPTGSDGTSFPRWAGGLVAFAVAALVVLAATLVIRRRPRPAAASS
jgi:hypothetical protein